MKLSPVGTASLLAVRQFQLYHTPRVLRLGLARSLLAERLRRSGLGGPSCGSTCHGRPASVHQPPAAVDPPGSTDRFWPSDLPLESVEEPVEVVTSPRVQWVLGHVLDVFS